MKRPILTLLFIATLLVSLFGTLTLGQAGFNLASPDIDQDGLTNEMESSGWYHLSGGPFRTNPAKADSDGDGLTDAEEKLFNTNPLDPTSPGLSVKYDSAFKTYEYYRTNDSKYLRMVQGGNRYLLTEALVVRRGTSFNILGVNSRNATLQLIGSGMTPITPVRDPARGGWKVTIPAGGTVGSYTARLTVGDYVKNFPIHVIFELPTGLTAKEMETYLYDDNPAVRRDEVAVFWRAQHWEYYNNESPTPTPCDASTPGVCSNWKYHQSFGFAQAFWTEQYTKNVLVNFSMPSVRGKTNPYDATVALATKADESVRINYQAAQNNFSDSVKWTFDEVNNIYYMVGGACETSAGVYTSMLRSVGIASTPFAHTYNKTPGHGEGGNFAEFEYDTAVMMWIKGGSDANNRWYAERTFRSDEPRNQPEPKWASGTSGVRTLERVGLWTGSRFNNFQDYNSDMIQVANEGWDFQKGSLGGGMVNTEWSNLGVPDAEFDNPASPDRFVNRDFKWDSRKPLNMIYQSPYIDLLNCQLWYGDGWAPIEWTNPAQSNPPGRNALQTYILPGNVLPSSNPIENWPYNPHPTICSPSSVGTADCNAFLAANNNLKTCTPLPGQTFSGPALNTLEAAPALVVNQNADMQFGNVTGEFGLDQDGDGRFEALVVEAEVNSTVAGAYRLGGQLRVGEETFRSEPAEVTLVAGSQTVQVVFDGQAIGDRKVNGPFLVEALWLVPVGENYTVPELREEMAAYQDYFVATQAYDYADFALRAAAIGNDYNYTTADQDANGLIDTVTVVVPLVVDIPGSFTLEGSLFDAQGNLVGRAAWTGSDAVATLDFAVVGAPAPYSLEQLLLTQDGVTLDSRYASVLTVDNLNGAVDMGGVTVTDVVDAGATLQAIDPSRVYSISQQDTDGNGRYDKLVISTNVNVTEQGGNFWMEGLLVDGRGVIAAWSSATPKALTVGTNRSLSMEFDGQQLFDQAPLSGSVKFYLVGVKIFSGTPASATVVSTLNTTGYSTPNYTRSQLEPTRMTTLFEDDMESGEGKWSKSGSWAYLTSEGSSGTRSFRAQGTGALTMAVPVNLSAGSALNATVKFRYAAFSSEGTIMELQASTNGGGSWSTIKTYAANEVTSYWTTDEVSLSGLQGNSNVRLRFNIPSSSNTIVYVDDVSIQFAALKVMIPAIIR